MTTQVETVEAVEQPKKAAPKPVRIPKAHSKTVAAKIRYLDSKGMKRADIARALDIRYQRVRNVLVPKAKPEETEVEAEAEEAEAEPNTQDLENLES
jgi:hypothetical protein